MHIALYLVSPSVPCFTITHEQVQQLKDQLPGVTVRHCQTDTEFVQALSTAPVAVAWRFEQDWVDAAPELEWIVTPAAGKDYFQITPKPGTTMTYGSFHGILMAETALAMMLANCRGLVKAQALRESGATWPNTLLAKEMRPFRGSHVVILGFGRIGDWIGRLAKPFGVRLTGIQRNPGKRPDYFTAEDRILPVAELENVLPEADHLMLVLPSGAETDGILDEKRLSLLPPYSYVYNIGRGNAIDEVALSRALQENRIAGACLDVYQKEPLPDDSPLRNCPNTVLMPHASAFSPNYLDHFIDEFVTHWRNRYGNDSV